eukprot:1590048-Rhodomonas_salina.1
MDDFRDLDADEEEYGSEEDLTYSEDEDEDEDAEVNAMQHQHSVPLPSARAHASPLRRAASSSTRGVRSGGAATGCGDGSACLRASRSTRRSMAPATCPRSRKSTSLPACVRAIPVRVLGGANCVSERERRCGGDVRRACNLQ